MRRNEHDAHKALAASRGAVHAPPCAPKPKRRAFTLADALAVMMTLAGLAWFLSLLR